MVKTSKIIATLGVAAGLGIALLPLASYAAETGSEDVEVEVNTAFTFAVKSYKAAVTTAEVNKVAMDRGAKNEELEHKITAEGNYSAGYVLTMAADHSYLLGETTSKQIPSIASTATALPTAGTIQANGHGWGYRVTDTAASGSSATLLGDYSGKDYNDIPTGDGDTLRAADTAARSASFDETKYVNFGIVTATDEVADTYKATITYTATPSVYGA
ncbi:hypothetical protein IJG21_00370 [Candidatus Saccharibacteria bacterium]|nr:hypothetical protein [Candidatus Saccharibacteria bacterium]